MIALKYGKRKVVNYRGGRMVIGGLSSKNRIDILVEISKEFASINSQKEVYDAVVALCLEIFEVDNVTLRLWDAQKNKLVPVRFLKQTDPPRRDLNSGEGYSGHVFSKLTSLLLDNLENYPDYLDPGETTRCAIVVPILSRDECFGTIAIEKDTPYFYKKDDLEILEAMASQLGLKLSEVKLIEGLVEARRRMDSDLRMGRDVQSLIIPSSIPPWNSIRFASYYEPMTEVSGDYFDVIRKGSSLTAMIADVSGHGVPAALITMSIHHAFNRCVEGGYGLVEMLDEINEALRPRLPDGSYITAQIIRIYSDQTYAVVNAGHIRAYHYRQFSGRFEPLESAGIPLGITRLRREDYVEDSGKLNPGDFIVLMTDGFIEQRTAKKEQVGIQKIFNWLENAFQSAEVVPDSLDRVMANFLESYRGEIEETPRGDDLSMLLLQAHPGMEEAKSVYRKAVQTEKEGDIQEALRLALWAFSIDDSFQKNLLFLAHLHARTHDYEKAARFLEKFILSSGEQSCRVYHALGVFNYKLARIRDAKRNLKKALALDHGHVRSSMMLARCYLKEGSVEKATKVLLHASKTSPHDDKLKKSLRMVERMKA